MNKLKVVKNVIKIFENNVTQYRECKDYTKEEVLEFVKSQFGKELNAIQERLDFLNTDEAVSLLEKELTNSNNDECEQMKKDECKKKKIIVIKKNF